MTMKLPQILHTHFTVANILPYLIQIFLKKSLLKPSSPSLSLDNFCFLPTGNHHPEVGGCPSRAHFIASTYKYVFIYPHGIDRFKVYTYKLLM